MSSIKYRSASPAKQTPGVSATALTHKQMDDNFWAIDVTEGTVEANKAVVVDSNKDAATLGKITLTDLIVNGIARFDEEVDNGNSGASKTITWDNGNKQKITLTATCAITFTNPTSPCNLILKVVQDGAGTWSRTWSTTGSLFWPNNGTEPTWSTGAGDVDIISLYFDGTDFYATAGLDFA